VKRFALFLALGLSVVGLALGQDDRGALGLGFASVQTDPDNLIAKAIRLNLFLDVGKRFLGRLYYGFELQGDVAQLNEQNLQLQSNEVSNYGLGGGAWTNFYSSPSAQTTYQLWDFDLSPRAYLSFDFGDKIELLGFGGLNYNWQTLSYTIKNAGDTAWVDSSGAVVALPGQKSSSSMTLYGNWQAVAGFRMSVAFFYFDFARYVNFGAADLNFSNYDLPRLGTGVSFRF